MKTVAKGRSHSNQSNTYVYTYAYMALSCSIDLYSVSWTSGTWNIHMYPPVSEREPFGFSPYGRKWGKAATAERLQNWFVSCFSIFCAFLCYLFCHFVLPLDTSASPMRCSQISQVYLDWEGDKAAKENLCHLCPNSCARSYTECHCNGLKLLYNINPMDWQRSHCSHPCH